MPSFSGIHKIRSLLVHPWVVVPHRLIKPGPVHSKTLGSQSQRQILHQLPHLTPLPGGIRRKQVQNLPGPIAVLQHQRRMVQTTNRLNMPRLMMTRHKQHVVIPRNRCPQPVGLTVITMVAIRAQIHIPKQPVHRMEAEVGGQVQIFPPPILAGVGPHPRHKPLPQLAAIGHSLGRVLDAALHTDGQSISKPLFPVRQQLGLHVPQSHINTPQVTQVGILRRHLLYTLNHPPLHPSHRRARHTRQPVGSHREHLIQTGHTAQYGQIGGRSTRIQVQAPKPRWKRLPRMVHKRQIMPFGELQAPLVLAGNVRATLPPVAELNMVIHNTPVHDGALLFLFVKIAIPLAARHILLPGYQHQRLQGLQKFPIKDQWRRLTRLACSSPLGQPAITPPGKVRATFPRPRQHHFLTILAPSHHPVTHHPPVALPRTRHPRRINPVPSHRVPIPAIV